MNHVGTAALGCPAATICVAAAHFEPKRKQINDSAKTIATLRVADSRGRLSPHFNVACSSLQSPFPEKRRARAFPHRSKLFPQPAVHARRYWAPSADRTLRDR